MVLRPASVLVRGCGLATALAVATAYFLLSGDLPSLGAGDGAVLAAGIGGIGAIAAVVLSVTRVSDRTLPVALLLAGSAVLVVVLDASGAGSSVSPFEALAAGSLGVLLGRALAAPAVALAIPVFVAIVDALSVAGGPSSRLANGSPRGAAELTFDLPSWGGAPGAGSRLGLTDAVFLAMFSVWAARFGLRPRATLAGMLTGLVGAVALSVAVNRPVPALPLIAVGYWLPNLDRFGALFAEPPAGSVSGMDLEEHTLESAGSTCEECGARLTDAEQAAVLESGGPSLCAIHAAEEVPLGDEDAIDDSV